MMAYANPPNRQKETEHGNKFGVARFDKAKRQITFECWPRFASVDDSDGAQYPE